MFSSGFVHTIHEYISAIDIVRRVYQPEGVIGAPVFQPYLTEEMKQEILNSRSVKVNPLSGNRYTSIHSIHLEINPRDGIDIC